MILMSYKPPERRIKVKERILKIIQKTLKKRGFTIGDIDKKIGYCFKNALYHGMTLSVEDFNKLKELIGSENLVKIFGIKDIPHKIMVGKSLQKKITLEENNIVSEFIGILLGDGHLSENSSNVSISFNGVDEADYVEYVKKLIKKLFKQVHIRENWERDSPNSSGNEKGLTLTITSISLHDALVTKGLIPGDKVQNQIKIPRWIFKKKEFKIYCLKGLFDTDGSIFIDKNHKIINLNFTSASKPLVQDFFKICNLLNIQPSPKIIKRKVDESKENPRFHLQIIAKDQVKRFLEIIDVEKLKDPLRRLYLGTQLIYLNESNEIIDDIGKKIKKEYPRESERVYSKSYAVFLKQTCEDRLGYKIKSDDINKAISNSFDYEIYVYRKEKAKYLKYLYEQLGNLEYIREYLKDNGEVVIPTSNTINIFIKRYMKTEEKNIKYESWLSEFRLRTIKVDNQKNEISRFPRKYRSVLNLLIFQVINETSKDISNSEIFKLLIKKLNNSKLLLVTWLLEKKDYNLALKNYIKNLIILIKEIYIAIKKNNRIGGKVLKKKFNLRFSVSRINEMIKDLNERLAPK